MASVALYLTAYSLARTFPNKFKLLMSQRNHLISSTVTALMPFQSRRMDDHNF